MSRSSYHDPFYFFLYAVINVTILPESVQSEESNGVILFEISRTDEVEIDTNLELSVQVFTNPEGKIISEPGHYRDGQSASISLMFLYLARKLCSIQYIYPISNHYFITHVSGLVLYTTHL